VRRLTVFTWGYWGWGNHTSDFVRTVDAIERSRGKRPPIFADIRFSRSVRAPGFRERAFEETVGTSRYRWLRKLGNANIGTGEKGVRITNPAGFEELLQLVINADRQNRRVIFFCACESARYCHRATVARFLHKIATRKRSPLTIIEWPGGEPKAVQLTVSAKAIKAVEHGGRRIHVNDLPPKTLGKLMALPWCSHVDLRSDDTNLGIFSGPAQLAADWYLPVVGFRRKADIAKELKAKSVKLRKALGYAAVRGDHEEDFASYLTP